MKTISFLLLLLTLACSRGEDKIHSSTDRTEAAMENLEEIPVAQQLSAPPPPHDSQSDLKTEQKIIKTAELVFPTENLNATTAKIHQLVSQYKGFVQSDNSGKDYNRIYRHLSIRIPTENFQSFIDGIAEGVDYFDQRSISRQDVSEEFIDLKARLKTKRELENRYLDLLKKAQNVKEMLEIERELSNIREEIEARQGRLEYLQNKVSLSTVNIEFYKPVAETGITQSYGQKMKNALQGGWNGISVFFLGVLYLWPLLIVAVVIVILLRIFLGKRKK